MLLSFQVIVKKLAKPLKLIANILDGSLEVLKSNSLMVETNAKTGGVRSASSPHWDLKSVFYTATLTAYFVFFLLAAIVVSWDAIISGDRKKGKGKENKSTRQASPKFSFRNPIIFCALGIIVAASFDVWAENRQVRALVCCIFTSWLYCSSLT